MSEFVGLVRYDILEQTTGSRLDITIQADGDTGSMVEIETRFKLPGEPGEKDEVRKVLINVEAINEVVKGLIMVRDDIDRREGR